MFLAQRISATLLGLSLALATACQKREPGPADQSLKAETSKPVAATSTSPAAEVAPPQSVSELQGVTARIYKEAVIVDGSRDAN
jgi:hypothetical protein